jgi:hypothetical protein
MSVKTEIEQFPILLNVARSLHYVRPGSTLADLKQELDKALVVTNDLIGRFGESAALNDRGKANQKPR